MAKNFLLNVFDPQDVGNHGVSVVVKTMLEATGLAASNLSKQRGVEITRTDEPHTHSTSAAAQAYIDVELFQLVPDNE